MSPQPLKRKTAVECTLSSLRPGFPRSANRELFFEGPHTLRNKLGHSFSLQVNRFNSDPPVYEVYLHRKSGCPIPCMAYMKFQVVGKKDKVVLTQLHAFNPMEFSRRSIYSPPAPHNKGYGFTRVAIFFARYLAQREGITRLTVTPASRELGEHYRRHGFVPQHFEAERGTGIEEMILQL